MNNFPIGQRLQALREQKGVSQDVAADACGMSRIALARYETGTRIPRMDKAAALAGYYGVTVDYILTGDAIIESAQKNDLPCPGEIDGAIAALSADLTPEELQLVIAYAEGIKAARKA